MIKVTDLMIGDYVFHYGKVWKVYSLEGPLPRKEERFNDKAIITLWCDGLISVLEEEVFPISITKDSLIQNDYEPRKILRYTEYVSPDGRIVASHEYTNYKAWNFHFDNEDFETIGDVECEYIHELQHALNHHGFSTVLK